MYDSFSDELTKIAKGYSPEQKDKIKRILATAGVTALGGGIGYGLGSAAGRLAGFKKPGLGRTKLLMGTIGGLGSLGGALLKERKKKYIDKSVSNSRNQ
jgi:hypothetical protein